MEKRERTLKEKMVSGFFWKLLENGGTQGIFFLVSILLARLIDPAEYGVLNLTIIFVSIAGVFVQSGFSLSLVQRKDCDDTDLSSVFWFTLIAASVLYLILFIAAPWIAVIYKEPEVRPALRVISLLLFFSSITSVQTAIIMRELEYRKRFFVSLVSILLSGTIGITMALKGFGVWALIAEQLTDNLTMCIGLSLTTRWLPSRTFSFSRIKRLFSFGWKLIASSFLDTLYSDLSGLIIGLRYNAAMLAQYDRGRKFPQLIITNATGAVQSAVFPAFSFSQSDLTRLKSMLRRSVTLSAFLMFPMMAGLAAVASPLVHIVLTDTWIKSVPFMQIFCIMFAMYPVDATVLQAFNGIGRSDIYLKLEIAKKICGLILLVLAVFVFDSPIAIALSLAATAVFSVVFNAIPARRMFQYSYSQQLGDILPALALSLAMFAMVFPVSFLPISPFLMLAVQILLGVLIYVGGAYLLKLDDLHYLLETIRQWISKRMGKNAEEKDS